MPTLGPLELIVILVILTVLFGAGWVAGTVGSLGKGVRQFRAELRKGDSPPDTEQKGT